MMKPADILSDISSERDRAVVEAVLGSSLSSTEIMRKFNLGSSTFCRIANLYLGKGYLQQRTQDLRAGKMADAAAGQTGEGDPHDAVEVIDNAPAARCEPLPKAEERLSGVPARGTRELSGDRRVTFDEVLDACTRLYGRRETISAESVRRELGHGLYADVIRYLRLISRVIRNGTLRTGSEALARKARAEGFEEALSAAAEQTRPCEGRDKERIGIECGGLHLSINGCGAAADAAVILGRLCELGLIQRGGKA